VVRVSIGVVRRRPPRSGPVCALPPHHLRRDLLPDTLQQNRLRPQDLSSTMDRSMPGTVERKIARSSKPNSVVVRVVGVWSKPLPLLAIRLKKWPLTG
jgi:hypothetical protein